MACDIYYCLAAGFLDRSVVGLYMHFVRTDHISASLLADLHEAGL